MLFLYLLFAHIVFLAKLDGLGTLKRDLRLESIDRY